ncbi:hypothetical protein C7999DRAFT_27902 [Corynascus novoguineensis]|uniref:Uncharacterized protein n=1 Tax=Corynascus novoguineensis TaxID=1126955 RepID=A0AAN7D0Z1_9PEZI|nr:hypothetical protein C7999DRAFT_27902 [Corynascus novoguineensis]
MNPSQANSASSPSPSTLRIFTRHPRLTLAGLAILGTGLGFRHISSSYRDNELAQKNSAAQNFYVSVDRSGGGV